MTSLGLVAMAMDWIHSSWIETIFVRIENFILFCAGFLLFYSTLDEGTQQDLLCLVTGQSKKAKKTGRYPDLPAGVSKEEKVKVCEKDVSNPFPSLENLQSEVTQDWMEAQHQCSVNYINHTLVDIKEAFAKEYNESLGIEMPDNPVNCGGMYFFFKKMRLELPQYTLFSTSDLHHEAKPVLDPNTLVEPSSEVQVDAEDGPALLAQMLTVHGVWLSGDGFKLVYGYSRGAGNSMSLAVRDLRTKEDPAVDVIRGCYVDYTAVSWVDSRSGFFYSTQLAVQPSDHSTSRESMDGDLATTYSNRVYFHKLGTRQASDLLIFETMTMSDSMMINTHITSDGHYLLLEIFKKRRELTGNSLWRSMVSDNCATSPVGNKVFYYDLCKFDGLYAESLGACVKLIDTFMYRFDYISSVEEDFWFRSNYQATNFRVVRVTLPELNSHEDDPEAEQCRLRLLNAWKNCLDWIPQRTDGDYLASAGIAAHTILVLKYLKDSSHEVLLYDLTQNLEKESQIAVASLPHPPYGTIIGPNCNFYSSEIFYQFTSYADPSSVYRALIERDPFTGAISISFHEVNSTSVPKYDKYMYDTEQVYVETMRNVSVPLLLFGLRETLDEIRAEGGEMRPRPTILFISGGFGISSTAVFSLPLLLFVKQCRGLVLVSNIQGSGIYGSYWCKSGAKENKDNCVADLQGIVKYAIDKGLTTPAQLCLYGGTYNGTIIGAAIARFPSLFSTAVIEDGVFDLIRYPVFNPAYVDGQSLADERFVKDSAWYQEFGCADDSPAELARLTALSPLLQLGVLSPPTSYPAVLLTAALPPEGRTYTNSVSPIHSLKFIAQLQRVFGKMPACQARPLLLYLTQDALDSADTNRAIERIHLGSTVEEMSTVFSFIISNIGAKWRESS